MGKSDWIAERLERSRPECEDIPDDENGNPREELEESGEPPAVREGLPPNYRMRHDRHYVDRLIRPASPPVRMVAVSQIDHQATLNPSEVTQLKSSIEKYGLLQPLLVRRQNGRYRLIAGARRLAAAAAAGLSEVPCVVHEVDEWSARALAEAANLRADAQVLRQARVEAGGERTAAGRGVPVQALTELTRHLEAIVSSLGLFAQHDRPLRERVAQDLARAEAERAARLAQALAVLSEAPRLSQAATGVGAVLGRVAERMRPECALSNVDVFVELPDGEVHAWADDRLLSIALSGLVSGVHALVEEVTGAFVRAVARAERHGVIDVEVSAVPVSTPASRLARFLDPGWIDRPGGCRVAMEVAAAGRIVEMHSGKVSFVGGAGEDAFGVKLELRAAARSALAARPAG